MDEMFIKHEYGKDMKDVSFILDCRGGCTKRALAELIKELQHIHQTLE